MKRIKYLVLLVLCVFAFTVSGCGKKPAKCEHTSSEWIIDKEATCTNSGSKYTECTKCHEKLETESIEALGHDLVHHEKKEATCKETGNEAYDTCSRCEYTTYAEIKKLDHKIVHHEGLDATCTESGYKAYDTCENCDYTTYEEIKKLDHEIVHHEGLDPTCTEPGYKAYDTCEKCDYTTYEELPALNHNYENGVCTNCRQKEPAKEYTIDGNYVYFGYYPQTIKDDSVTIISNSPDSDGYYLGSDNERYAKVTAKPYVNSSNQTMHFSNSQQIVRDTVYYFKVEPIKWRILSSEDGTYKLLAELIIDSQMFYSAQADRTISGKTIYANNYEYSDIRKWLNEDFYNKAFTEIQKTFINTVLVDNSLASTGSDNNNDYICNDTNDKVYLLSQQDVKNDAYGFKAGVFEKDTLRQKSSTDYARAVGCGFEQNLDTYYWWLRTPSSANLINVATIRPDSKAYGWRGVYAEEIGVVPAITVTLN